jgi:hypothetical protein
MKKINNLFRILLMTTICISFVSLTAYGQEKTPPKKKSKAPVIEFEKTVHDYGNIMEGDNGDCEFKFKNTGKEPLVLTNVYSSCGCTVPVWPTEPIMPKKTAVIKVKYNTTRLGTINKKITVISNAENGTIELFIKGNVSAKPQETLPDKTQSPVETQTPQKPF